MGGSLDCAPLTLSPCGRGWLREAKTGEGLSPHRSLRDSTPHRTAVALASGEALSHKGRGRIHLHRGVFFRQPHSAASASVALGITPATLSGLPMRWGVPSWRRITVPTGTPRL